MKKIIIFVTLIIILIIGAFFVLSDKSDLPENDQVILQKTLDISRSYASLRFKTDNVLLEARNYSTYEEWKNEIDIISAEWLDMEKEALTLENLAKDMVDEKISFKLLNSALAYDKQEISNIFDRAPAGKKIVTLARHLGVDAKKAHAILTQDQAQVQADAWNEAGDTFKKLEATAVAIKNACKVVTFVGTVVATGGATAIAGQSVLAQAAVVVAGADLTLEVTDDAAKIALGDKNKVSTIVGNVRVVTEPAAAILMISVLPNNLTKSIDKLGAVTFGADQLNSTVQEGKVIGMKLPVSSKSEAVKNPTVSVLENEEVWEWLNNEVDNYEELTEKNIKDILNINTASEASSDYVAEIEVENIAEQKDSNNSEPVEIRGNESIIGIWKGVISFPYSTEEDDKDEEFVLEIKKDGRLGGEAGEYYEGWEMTDGNLLRLRLPSDEGSGYDEFKLAVDSLTFLARSGFNSEGVWERAQADSSLFGGKYMQIHLKKQ